MAPLTPTWTRPSHPNIQKVVFPINPSHYTTKSLSKVDLAPHAVFANMAFPPCTKAKVPTYATVQMGKHEHLNLNSELVYINHSCDPSLILDTSSLNIIAGGRGLKAGEELTFFYPSTEWDMEQSFDCLCGSQKCLGYIGGAQYMTPAQLEGRWLNTHIQSLLEERTKLRSAPHFNELTKSAAPELPDNEISNSHSEVDQDPTEAALLFSLTQARKMVDAAQKALDIYISIHSDREKGVGSRELSGEMGGDTRRGITSRELSGEMGGDTVQVNSCV